MFHRSLIILVFFFLTANALAQKGDLFLTHHELNIDGMDNLNFDIASNSKGQLCIANRSGILFYDGHKWDFVATPSSALSIAFDHEDNLYVGCVGDFGMVGYKDDKFQFISLNPNESDHGLFNRTMYKDSSVFFMSEHSLHRYHVYQKKSNLFYLNDSIDYFTNMFEVDGNILLQTSDTLYAYQNDSLAAYDWDPPENAHFLFFDKHPSEDKYVVGTSDNKTFIYRAPKFYECKISEFLEEHESFVNDGKWVNDRYFALSTLEDGCILYDNKKSEIKEVINQSKGLPDDQIFAIGADQEEGLWISHNYGLSRMEVSIPFRSFSNFQGLHGNISEVYFHERTLFAATSEGVYYLDKEDIFKNTVYYVEKKPKNKKSARKSTSKADVDQVAESSSSETEADSKSNKKIKKWAKRLFGNTRSEAEPKEDKTQKKKSKSKKKEEKYTNPQQIRKSQKKQYEKRIRKEFLFSKYLFKPVKGIHSKVEKFIVYQGKLLAAGTNGVYEINEGEGELVIHEPVRLIEYERKTDQLIIGTHYDEIKLYELDDDIWVISDEIDLQGNLILNVLNDVSGRTWFITASSLYEFNSLNSQEPDFNVYEFDNPFVDKVRLSYIDRQLYLINNQGYFYLNTTLEKIVEDTTLMQKVGRPVKHLQERKGTIWVFNGESWYRINKDKTAEEFDKFRLFPEMNYISTYGGMLWLLDDSKEILQYVPSLTDSLITVNKMFFRKVTTNFGEIRLGDRKNFEHDENTFRIEMSRPDYRGLLRAEYQYRLKGLNSKWSSWQENNRIDFNYLPPGNYSLKVRSRDSFGNIQESEEISFVIHKPYWQTLWFYAIQIFIMCILVIGSIMMNRKAQKKYVLLTEALTILTIVLVIEFLQSAAGSYLNIKSTPLVDFSIDVGVALCVFPLEQFLKKLMKAGKKNSGYSEMGIIDILKLPFKNRENTAGA